MRHTLAYKGRFRKFGNSELQKFQQEHNGVLIKFDN